MFFRQFERAAIAAREQLRFPMSAAPPYRADRVNHVAGRQAMALGDLGIAGRTAAERAALAQEIGPRLAMDRAVDAAAAKKRCVRRVDDRIDRQYRDVALYDLDRCHCRCLPRVILLVKALSKVSTEGEN